MISKASQLALLSESRKRRANRFSPSRAFILERLYETLPGENDHPILLSRRADWPVLKAALATRNFLELAFQERNPYLRDWQLFCARDAWDHREIRKRGAVCRVLDELDAMRAKLSAEGRPVDTNPEVQKLRKKLRDLPPTIKPMRLGVPTAPEDRYFANAQKYLSDSMAVCTNPACPRPYYFRRKPKQRVCSKKCQMQGVKRSQAKWEKTKGKAWRAARREKRRGQNPPFRGQHSGLWAKEAPGKKRPKPSPARKKNARPVVTGRS